MAFEQLGTVPLLPKPVRSAFRSAANRRGGEFHALRDVNFGLEHGDSLGIIGRNGSGKSTLLQILAGTLEPSAGEVRIDGRIAALLELGSGFNPEFSGRENVMLQGALFGLSKKTMGARMAEVEEFAGIGEFIDQPAKVYSSGMLVRLAFATQTILSPDLFIVDEALAVGDVFFQAKCARFFEERLRAGMSLILVSHDLVAVKALCRNSIVLHQGHVAFFGPSAEAISHYHQLHRGKIASSTAGDEATATASSEAGPVALPAGAVERNWNTTQEVGSREAEFIHCRLCDAEGTEHASFEVDEEVRLELYSRSHVALDGLVVAFELTNRHNQVAYGATSVHLGVGRITAVAERLHRHVFVFRARLGAGEYLIDVALGWGDRGDGAPEQLIHRVARIAAFTVRHPGLRPRFFGMADLQARLDIA